MSADYVQGRKGKKSKKRRDEDEDEGEIIAIHRKDRTRTGKRDERWRRKKKIECRGRLKWWMHESKWWMDGRWQREKKRNETRQDETRRREVDRMTKKETMWGNNAMPDSLAHPSLNITSTERTTVHEFAKLATGATMPNWTHWTDANVLFSNTQINTPNRHHSSNTPKRLDRMDGAKNLVLLKSSQKHSPIIHCQGYCWDPLDLPSFDPHGGLGSIYVFLKWDPPKGFGKKANVVRKNSYEEWIEKKGKREITTNGAGWDFRDLLRLGSSTNRVKVRMLHGLSCS